MITLHKPTELKVNDITEDTFIYRSKLLTIIGIDIRTAHLMRRNFVGKHIK